MSIHVKRAAALKSAQAIIDAAKSGGRDLTDQEVTQVEGLHAEIKGYDASIARVGGQKSLTQAIAEAAGPMGESGDGTQYLDLGSKAHAITLTYAMKGTTPEGAKALVTNGSVVVGTPLIDTTPVTLGRPLRSFLEAIPSVERPAAYSYLAQSVRTENAAVVSNGAVKPTSVLSLVKKDGKLSVIATLSELMDKFVLSDGEALQTWVGQELTQSVLTALETQVLSGNGTGDNLTGLANTSGIQTFTSTAGNTDKLVELRKALTKLETAGEVPVQFILNPADWEALTIKRNASGEFDTGSAINAETRKAWGVPVALSNSLAANSYYLLGEGAAVIGRDAGIVTEWGTPGDAFTRNQVQARTEGRFSLECRRPSAVLKGTFVTV
ncbi:HK97 family phage major capsid protein [Arthrobacter pascens]|uniref:phage major capsid protein n=1 Tax=Arthrobacter pascens TaxID=1677 RepID=UPI00278956D0|nr:phage major capsid protein [Arthrobacter pascens]MDQ0633347.1 HK97 family phage major capsid protein [Arthrobacter pascens]